VNRKTIIFGLIFFVVTLCVCPICFAFLFFVVGELDNATLREWAGLLAFAAMCGIPLLFFLVVAGWQLRHILRTRTVGRRLAGAMGLEPLNQANKLAAIWHGGEHQGHRFAIAPFGVRDRANTLGSNRTGTQFVLRIVMAIQVSEPLGVVVYRGPDGASRNPQNFDEAFDQENAGRLTGEAQTAMFEFVQKGYRTGLVGVTLRLDKGTRDLRLRDRATAPEKLLAPEVLPDANVILVHDHADTTISTEGLRALLDEMAAIARLVEKSV
jgi:hypothetical protein